MRVLYSWPLISFVSLFSLPATAQNEDLKQLGDGYYVVVSAYRPAQSKYARQLTEKINQSGKQADYGLDASRNYCYVYLDRYGDLGESLQQMKKTREAGEFSDAWVRVMKGGDFISETVASAKAENITEKKKLPTATVYLAIPKQEIVEEKEEEPAPASTETAQVVTASAEPVAVEVIENPTPDPVIIPQTLANTPIFLSMFNARNSRIVDGEIEVIDTERARSITKVKGNTYLSLPDPKSKSGELTLICSAFGYRKVQHQIHYKDTETDTLQPYVDLVGNFYLVKFDLVRLHKGDISVLYNVYFYNDAAIMMPESKPELNGLLEMMRDNPGYRIRLHGHTNGNAAGKLVTMGPSHDFFTITPDAKQGMGSAKDLSRERAEIIKEWLAAQGIAGDRVEIKAWGGGRMLHDKHSVHARRNVRVEVEVVED